VLLGAGSWFVEGCLLAASSMVALALVLPGCMRMMLRVRELASGGWEAWTGGCEEMLLCPCLVRRAMRCVARVKRQVFGGCRGACVGCVLLFFRCVLSTTRFKDAETNFRGQAGAFYTVVHPVFLCNEATDPAQHCKVETVWFALQHKDKQWMAYVQECRKFKFHMVSFLDHKDLLNYLKGPSSSSCCETLCCLPRSARLRVACCVVSF